MRPELIDIVLVNPSHPGNIGGVARAMKNMGLRRLCLVAPRRFPHPQADERATHARDLLASARVVDDLDAALADARFVVGTSARGRRIPWPVQDPRRCAARIAAASTAGQRVAVLFGREDRGLSNGELNRCNLHLHIPADAAYSSLNLAMAVQVVCYELRMLAVGAALPAAETAEWDAPFSTQADMERFYVHLEETLAAIGFLDPAAPRQLMPRLRRLYGRVRLDEMELNMLRGVLTATQEQVRRAQAAPAAGHCAQGGKP